MWLVVRLGYWELAIGTVLLIQAVVGTVGNASLLSYHLLIYYNECTLKNTGLIFTHLIMANSLTILSKVVLQIMATFGLKGFFDDFGCRLILYFRRVGKSMSISTTCLLSVFKAITIKWLLLEQS